MKTFEEISKPLYTRIYGQDILTQTAAKMAAKAYAEQAIDEFAKRLIDFDYINDERYLPLDIERFKQELK